MRDGHVPAVEKSDLWALPILAAIMAFSCGVALDSLLTFPDDQGILKLNNKVYRCVEVKEVKTYEPKKEEAKP